MPQSKLINIKNMLIKFEEDIKELYENKKIRAPIHLSGNNEDQLIKIYRKIFKNDWVFSTWRNHYHALLHGISEKELKRQILIGKSMSIYSTKPKFYSSAIVGGIIPIALGAALALKLKKSKNKVYCFIGDMTFETGTFHECYKYKENFKLPLNFIVEDNNLSTNTETKIAWNKKTDHSNYNLKYYKYKRKYPHHGVGKWVLF